MSFGHDEYLYQVLKNHKARTMSLLYVTVSTSFQDCNLPPEALYMVRFHSFYPWHAKGDYEHLASNYDKEMLSQLLLFKYEMYQGMYQRNLLQRVRPLLKDRQATANRGAQALLPGAARLLHTRQDQVLIRRTTHSLYREKG